ncbi:MAG: hypothetical protein AB1Z23_01770 [Eubacteriales bacterium]
MDNQEIIKPNKETVLYRYMDKWKYDYLINNGLVFTNAMNQEDEYDCYNHEKSSGYAKVWNAWREYMLISCWTMDDFSNMNIEEKISKLKQYCKFEDTEGVESNLAYVTKTNINKLDELISIKCDNLGNFTAMPSLTHYAILKNKVEYIDTSSDKENKLILPDNYPFYKDICYKGENEYRLFIYRAGVFIYDKDLKNYILDSDYKPTIEVMQGNPADFLTDVFEYNKRTNEFKKIGIPIIHTPTKKRLGSFKPSTFSIY